MAPRLGQRSGKAWSHLALIEDLDEEDYQPAWTPTSLAGSQGIMEQAAPARVSPYGVTRNVSHAEESRGDERSRPAQESIALTKTRHSAVAFFWYSLLAVLLLGSILVMSRGGPVVAAFVVLLALPVAQLIAAGIAAGVLLFSRSADRSFQLRQLGKITLGVLCGTGFGTIPMICLGLVFAGPSAGLVAALVVTTVITLVSFFGLRALARHA